MKTSFLLSQMELSFRTDYTPETELPGKIVAADHLNIIAHRYYFAGNYVARKRVLEICCGPGLGLGYLAIQAENVVGCDINEQSLKIAGRSYGSAIGLVRADAHELPFRDGSFDVVICIASIIYLNASKFIRECSRLLARNGVLVLNTPNKNHPGFNPSRMSNEYHSVPELNQILTDSGFRADFYGSFPAGGSKPSVSRDGYFGMFRMAVSKAISVFCSIPDIPGVGGLIMRLWVKLALGGRYSVLPARLSSLHLKTAAGIPAIPLLSDTPDQKYRIIYVVATTQ